MNLPIRMRHCFVFIILFSVINLLRSHSVAKDKLSSRRLLIISLDGFRWDFVQRLPESGHIKRRLLAGGVFAPKGMKNVFVTKTFPNHYSLATGLYEESSGIVSNSFWSPEYKKVVHLQDHADEKLPKLFKGNPIWTTYLQQRPEPLVGCYMWVGCLFEIQGLRLNRTMPYEQTVPWKIRADVVTRWLAQEHVELALLYFPEPDATNHQYGPESPESIRKVKELDENIGYLLDQLEFAGQLPSLNIILTSDHGFTTVVGVTNVAPNDALFKAVVKKDDFWHIEPNPGKENATFDYFKQFDHVKLYHKTDLNLHYSHTQRLPSLILLADFGWAIQDTSSSWKYSNKGTHGYNNSRNEMWPFFIAQGPAFRTNTEVPVDFHSIDVYNVMCRVLRLCPAPNNGSMSRAEAILTKGFLDDACMTGGFLNLMKVVVGTCVGATVFVLLAGFIYIARNRRNVRYSRPLVEKYSLLRTDPVNGFEDGGDDIDDIDSSDSEDLGPPVLPKLKRPQYNGSGYAANN